jgi:hypothetical protein
MVGSGMVPEKPPIGRISFPVAEMNSEATADV